MQPLFSEKSKKNMAVKSLLNWLDPIRLDEREKFLKKSVTHLIGASPSNLTLYRLAFLHASASKESISQNYKESNERLEFLGDSVLGMITASMYGDALEAFIGAVYLDKGFAFTQNFIIKKILTQYFDLEAVVQNNPNFKSMLIEWAQKEGKKVAFELDQEGEHHNREFTALVMLDGEKVSEGKGYSKKKAEQTAARMACEILEIKS